MAHAANHWVLVTGDFTPLGGMDSANWALARHLAHVGTVDLVTHRAWPDLVAMPNVTVHTVWRPLGKHILGEPLLDRAGRSWAKKLSTAGARVLVNGGNCRWFDVNWVHYVHAAYDGPTPNGFTRRLKAKAYHNRSLARERSVIPRSRRVICNSHLTANHVVEKLGVSPGRVKVVYYGSDLTRFPAITPTERRQARQELGWAERPWAVFVGAMGDARKGFDTLYAAWRELCRKPSWDANLAVVGRGAEVLTWQAQAQVDGLADRIHFLGFRNDVPRILAAADLMVHPARYEAYGLGVQEALCRGLPVLVSASAGVAERYPMDLHDLLLADPDNAAELADKLQTWRDNIDTWPHRLAPFATALRAHTWDDMAKEFVAAVGTGES